MAAYEIARAAKAFTTVIGEAQDALAANEQRGLDPARFPVIASIAERKRVFGFVPGRDAYGRALMSTMHRPTGAVLYRYERRTRALSLMAARERLRFVQVVKKHSHAASGSAPARNARAVFWEAMRAARARDKLLIGGAGSAATSRPPWGSLALAIEHSERGRANG